MSQANPRFDEDVVRFEDFVEILNPKEMECLCLRCEGDKFKDIADKLGISPVTVRNYNTSIFNKTGIHSAIVLCQILRAAKQRTAEIGGGRHAHTIKYKS